MKPALLLSRPDLAQACRAFRLAAHRSRAWNRLVNRSIAEFGPRESGTHISGIYSDHFPQARQDRLRILSHGVTKANEIAYSLKPKRVQNSTMRALREAVRAKFGGGYYG